VQAAAVPLNLLPFAAISDEPYSTFPARYTNAKQATITVAQLSARDFWTL
jgi:hypothetical protein